MNLNYLRLAYHLPTMAASLTLRALVILLGWILIPIAAGCKAYTWTWDGEKHEKKENPWVAHFTWPIMRLWQNFEDGIANDMYWKAPNTFLQIIYWSAIRNPANGLRTLPYISCQLRPEKINFIGSFPPSDLELYDTKIPQFFYCWQGLHSNIYWQFYIGKSLYRFWIGSAKLYPTDILGGPYGYRAKGSGPVIQFKKVL